jgi:hypothetical protein
MTKPAAWLAPIIARMQGAVAKPAASPHMRGENRERWRPHDEDDEIADASHAGVELVQVGKLDEAARAGLK